jgi:hypothetical protein
MTPETGRTAARAGGLPAQRICQEIALALTARAAQEPGTLTYRWFGPDRGSYLVIEQYTDTSAALAHNERSADLLARVEGCAELACAELYGALGPELLAWASSRPQVTAYPDLTAPAYSKALAPAFKRESRRRPARCALSSRCASAGSSSWFRHGPSGWMGRSPNCRKVCSSIRPVGQPLRGAFAQAGSIMRTDPPTPDLTVGG